MICRGPDRLVCRGPGGLTTPRVREKLDKVTLFYDLTGMSDITFSVTATAASPTRTDVEARNFSLVLDEPPSLGGTDSGPNPVEYELASLAGCLNVTGHVVAREMGITIESLTMTLSGALNPARFMGQSDADRAGFKGITVDMKVSSSADAATLEKWRDTVESRCPVSDNLVNGTTVAIRVAP
ncbi:Uncharacterized OsmC-related protein [Alkalispirochaeta americana]|uniref:Uncharacterized OsmC-related protein n=2 Tax=Alkalispirochaeta americana TaxID=159291 RepID=A0A1N6QHP4_9SPIO|nr:Uncharacterized OsmC-related protein [Alkalispirochaeta americana]